METLEQLQAVNFNDVSFKTDALRAAVKIMLENNFTVLITPSDGKISYATFSDGENIGYCQAGDYGHGVTFSTVHKGNRNCGTGFGLQEWHSPVECPTLSDIKRAFIHAPNWASQKDRESVVKYKGFDEYFKNKINNILPKVKVVGGGQSA